MSNWYKIAQEEPLPEEGDGTSVTEQWLKNMHELKTRGKTSYQDEFHYKTLEDFFLQNAKHYQSQPLGEEELEILNKWKKITKYYKMKQCFYNAQDLATLSPRIKYIEGYVSTTGIPFPIEHGWNTINDKVIDFTMYHSNNGNPILGIIPEGWEYYGVQLPTKLITKHWMEYETADSLVRDYKSRYPLLRSQFNPEAV